MAGRCSRQPWHLCRLSMVQYRGFRVLEIRKFLVTISPNFVHDSALDL